MRLSTFLWDETQLYNFDLRKADTEFIIQNYSIKKT